MNRIAVWKRSRTDFVRMGGLRRLVNRVGMERRPTGYVYVALGALVIAGAVYCLFRPSTTLALTALSALPFVYALSEAMSEREKMVWAVVSVALILGVGRGLAKEQKEHDENNRQINAQFSETKEAIGATIHQEQQQFSQTMGQFVQATQRLSHIADLEQENLNIETGGNSYLWYEPMLDVFGDNAIAEYKNSVLLQAFPKVFGHYTIPYAHVEVVGPTGWTIGGASGVPPIEYQGMRPNELARSRQGLSIKFYPKGAQAVFHVFINTANGSYDEIIILNKNAKGSWDMNAKLYRGTEKKPLYALTPKPHS